MSSVEYRPVPWGDVSLSGLAGSGLADLIAMMGSITILRALALGLFFSVLMPVVSSVSAQENGIYADFTTSKGSFTCRLDYTNAPNSSSL